MSNETTDRPGSARQHPNDMYGNIDARSEDDSGVAAPIPAATVVLLRDGDAGIELLMLKKNSKITFGGMWVFPGGKIDAEDYPISGDVDRAARVAAARETQEEAGLSVSAEEFVQIAHWTPPPGPQKRFATWFFAAQISGDEDIAIDDGEIKAHAWIRPQDALAKHAEGEIDLVPPTWITLYHLSKYSGLRCSTISGSTVIKPIEPEWSKRPAVTGWRCGMVTQVMSPGMPMWMASVTAW